MEKQTLVMVSSKVLNQMVAYRKHNYCFASYKEASNSIKTEIDKFRSDSFRADINYHAQSSPRLFIRQFQSQLIVIASKCLLAAAECGRMQILYDDLFSTFFNIAEEMKSAYPEDTVQSLDTNIINKFEDFEAGVNGSHANTMLLYHIAVNCVFLFNYVEEKSNPVAYEVKQ